MSNLKDKLAASVRQQKAGPQAATPASPQKAQSAVQPTMQSTNQAAARKPAETAAPKVPVGPVTKGTAVKSAVPSGFSQPGRVWPD